MPNFSSPLNTADDNAAANAEALQTAKEIVVGDRVNIHIREVRLARALLRFEHINAMLRDLLKPKEAAKDFYREMVEWRNRAIAAEKKLDETLGRIERHNEAMGKECFQWTCTERDGGERCPNCPLDHQIL